MVIQTLYVYSKIQSNFHTAASLEHVISLEGVFSLSGAY